MTDISINPDFEKWALGFSGCDGGNLSGPLWFCGIEYGQNDDAESLKRAFLDDVSTPSSIPDDAEDLRIKELVHQYNVKLLKMYSAILGKDVGDYRAAALDNKYLSKNGQLFKMNLYPIAFGDTKDDLWGNDHFKLTGMPTKTIYKAWCQINRFKEINNWVKNAVPRAIICTGVNLRHEFAMAFCGFENVHADLAKLKPLVNHDGTRTFYWMPINNNKTILFVTPFFGNAYGLNKDEHFTDIGSRVREICKSHFGENWLSKTNH